MGQPINTTGGTNNGTGPDCTVNGHKVKGCAGTVTVNGQTCTLSFANNNVNMVCRSQTNH